MARLRQFVQLLVWTSAVLLGAVLLWRALLGLNQWVQALAGRLNVAEWLDYALATGLLVLLLVVGVRGGRLLGKSGMVAAVDAQSVLVYINGGWQPGLLIERTFTGANIVYVPHAPHARTGAIYVVEPFQITPLDIPAHELQAIVERKGKGLSDYTETLFQNG